MDFGVTGLNGGRAHQVRDLIDPGAKFGGAVEIDAPEHDPGPGRRRWELVAAGTVFLAVAIYFIYTMLYSYYQGYVIGVGVVIPVAMAVASLWIVRYGWKRRC
jgi:hypothetical protein